MELPIEIASEDIGAFCRKHHIAKLALFGSVLTASAPTAMWTSWSSLSRTTSRD